MVGSLTTDKESFYGDILAPYLADPRNLFVISSDFCHWGQRFRYTFYEKSWGEIHQSIKTLDHKVKYILHVEPFFSVLATTVKYGGLIQEQSCKNTF